MTDEQLQLLTPKDVAELLRVPERTVIYLAQNNQLAGTKVAGKWRFKRGDIAAYLDRQREGQQGASSS